MKPTCWYDPLLPIATGLALMLVHDPLEQSSEHFSASHEYWHFPLTQVCRHSFTLAEQIMLQSPLVQTCSHVSPSHRMVVFPTMASCLHVVTPRGQVMPQAPWPQSWLQSVALQTMASHTPDPQPCRQRPSIALDVQLMLHWPEEQACTHTPLLQFMSALAFDTVCVQFFPPTGHVIWQEFSLQTCVQKFASQVIVLLPDTCRQVLTVLGQLILLQFERAQNWLQWLALQVKDPQFLLEQTCWHMSNAMHFKASHLLVRHACWQVSYRIIKPHDIEQGDCTHEFCKQEWRPGFKSQLVLENAASTKIPRVDSRGMIDRKTILTCQATQPNR